MVQRICLKNVSVIDSVSAVHVDYSYFHLSNSNIPVYRSFIALRILPPLLRILL